MKRRVKLAILFMNKIGLISTLSYFIQRIVLKKDGLIKLKIPSVKSYIYLRNKSYDTHIFNQIFIKEELGFVYKMPFTAKTILDAGANIGLSTIYLKNIFPEACIISIEPSTSNFSILEKNTSIYGGICLIKGALMGTNQMVAINNPLEDYASYRVSPSNNLDTIQSYTISDILQLTESHTIDLIKMDIEGSEKDVFENLDNDSYDCISSFAIEIHDHLFPGAHALIIEKLANFQCVPMESEYTFFIKNMR